MKKCNKEFLKMNLIKTYQSNSHTAKLDSIEYYKNRFNMWTDDSDEGTTFCFVQQRQ